MKKTILYIFLTGFFACSKHGQQPTENTDCTDYVPGKVSIGIKSTASIEDAFKLCNQLNLQIEEINGFTFTSSYPADSLPGISAYLATIPYINTNGFSAYAFIKDQTDSIYVNAVFFDMNPANQDNWVKTEKLLHLLDAGSDTKFILLDVPAGQEKTWKQTLQNNSIVSWAELDCIIFFQTE